MGDDSDEFPKVFHDAIWKENDIVPVELKYKGDLLTLLGKVLGYSDRAKKYLIEVKITDTTNISHTFNLIISWSRAGLGRSSKGGYFFSGPEKQMEKKKQIIDDLLMKYD